MSGFSYFFPLLLSFPLSPPPFLPPLSPCIELIPTCSIQTMSTSAIPEDEIIDASSGKWLRFNDNLVDEFTMSETSLEAECFGGSYKAKASDGES